MTSYSGLSRNGIGTVRLKEDLKKVCVCVCVGEVDLAVAV